MVNIPGKRGGAFSSLLSTPPLKYQIEIRTLGSMNVVEGENLFYELESRKWS